MWDKLQVGAAVIRNGDDQPRIVYEGTKGRIARREEGNEYGGSVWVEWVGGGYFRYDVSSGTIDCLNLPQPNDWDDDIELL